MGKETLEVSKYQEDLYFLPATGEGYKKEYWVKFMFGHIYFYNKYDTIGASAIVILTEAQMKLLWEKMSNEQQA